MEICYVLYAVIIVGIIYLLWRWLQYNPTESSSNGVRRSWNVLGRYDNNQEAANAMAALHGKLMSFLEIAKLKYKVGVIDEDAVVKSMTPDQLTKRQLITNLLRNYNPEVLYENDAKLNGGTSWTNNKGESMYMCLRKDSDPTQIEDQDISFFVLLHECAHIANQLTWHHDDYFWDVFGFLLREAADSGVYKPIDYSQNPSNFCGLKISYNPYFDASANI